jgi:hypothetical protein
MPIDNTADNARKTKRIIQSPTLLDMLSLQSYRKTSGNDANSIVLHIHLNVHVSTIMKKQ